MKMIELPPGVTIYAEGQKFKGKIPEHLAPKMKKKGKDQAVPVKAEDVKSA